MCLNKNKFVPLVKDSDTFEISKDDVFIETKAEEGFSAVSDSGLTVGLSLTITDELLQEGMVRDLIRQVQMMRKDAGFAVEDRIKIYWELTDDISSAMLKFKGYFCTETLTVELVDSYHTGKYSQEIQVGNHSIKVGIEKV